IPSSASFYFDELTSNGIIKKGLATIQETDLCEISAMLECGDSGTRIICPFPLFNFYEVYDFSCIDSIDLAALYGQRLTLMFACKSLLDQGNLLSFLVLAIKDLWLELIEGGALLEQALDLLLYDHDYLRFMARMAGVSFITSHRKTGQPVNPRWLLVPPQKTKYVDRQDILVC
ncbi:MAG: hypothetical protein KDD62_04180, partial [Bdellovibrionales bacterium]|nr:hypothetical protein [Bdellovibrionales bacterium]